MSRNKSFTLFKDLKPRLTKWRVQVKVIRSWKQTPPYADESLEMVLVDETGNKIHASCERSQMFRTQRNLKLGEWGVIEKFKVSGVGKGKYRPTSNQYKITITNETVFSGSDHQDDNIFLSLADYNKISNGSQDVNILIDIIGQPYDISGVQLIEVKDENRKRCQFRMRDMSGNNLAFCLWGSYAEQIEKALEESDLSNTVWLLRFAKISSFRGEIQITNGFDATLFDMNPTVAEAVEFKNWLPNDPLYVALASKKDGKSEIIAVADDWNDIGITKISELVDIIELEQTKIICSVKAIDTDWNWFYFGCKKCFHGTTYISGKGAKTDKPLFRCRTCRANVSNVEPKFKLHMIVEDDTGTCKLMMLDTVAKTIIGCEAIDLWDGSYEETEDADFLPQAVLAVVGKSFCFGITESADASDIYKVSQVWSGDVIEKIESQSEPLTLMEGVSSSVSSGGCLMIQEKSQPSSDCETPLSKRKENDADLTEMTSTSKKICLNPIKLEKTKTE